MTENYKEVVMDLVDDIKAISTNAGLGGEAGEYNLVTQSFLYKFLNDKFLYEAKKVDDNYDSKTRMHDKLKRQIQNIQYI